MKLQRIETPGISHYAYLISDGAEAALIDPRRDVDVYLEAARRAGVRIKFLVETHRQEDFVIGAAYLAQRVGVRIVTGDHELFGHGDLRLKDGDTFAIGSLKVCALHTPGHTLESMCYAVYPEGSDRAWCVFTGDALFFGTTGRTDLIEAGKAEQHAAQLYDALHEKIAPLSDGALVLPAHGPGSVCGSGMADRPCSTLGEEKQYNDVFTQTREQFAKKKGAERLPRPPYFTLMEKLNLQGGKAPAFEPGELPLLDVEAFDVCGSDGLIIDCREPEGFAGGHREGSYSIWLGGLPVFGGWIANEKSPVLLITERTDDIDTAMLHLTRIGIDNIQCALAGGFGAWRSSGKPMGRSGTITPRELNNRRESFQLLDVRDFDEFDTGHIRDAVHIYVGNLEERLESLPLDPLKPVVVTCSVGHRAGLAVSILLRHGFQDVRNLLGGMTAWNSLR